MDRTARPQRIYAWEMSILDPSLSDTVSAVKIPNHVQTSTIPRQGVTVKKKYHRGSSYYHRLRSSSNKQITFTFWDDESMVVYRYFYNWLNSVKGGDNEGNQAPLLSLTRDIHIKMKDTSDVFVNGVFILENCIPIGINDIDLNYTDSAFMPVSVTFNLQRSRFTTSDSISKIATDLTAGLVDSIGLGDLA